MFASYAQDADLKVNDVPPTTSKDEFINSPEKLCTEIIVSDQSSQTRYHYKVQDTPGYDSMEVRPKTDPPTWSCCTISLRWQLQRPVALIQRPHYGANLKLVSVCFTT